MWRWWGRTIGGWVREGFCRRVRDSGSIDSFAELENRDVKD